MRHYYLVSYDIAEPRRLARVLRTVRDFGDRVQYSVYMCQLSSKDLATLKARLDDEVNHSEDQVLFIRLAPATQPESLEGQIDYLGLKPDLVPDEVIVI